MVSRPPLEYAFALDSICTKLSRDDLVYVVTNSSILLQAVVNRHKKLAIHSDNFDSDDVENVRSILRSGKVSIDEADCVLLLDPSSINQIKEIIYKTKADCLHHCIVGNPYSFNQVYDRSVSSLLSPRKLKSIYESNGFETILEGYHGPRSVLESIIAQLWLKIGRVDKYEEAKYRVRSVIQEQKKIFSLISSIIHLKASNKKDE